MNATVDRLDGYLLALLYAKRPTMFPFDERNSIGQSYKRESHKTYLDYLRIVEKVVFPFFPACPIVHMSPETKVSREFLLDMTDAERMHYLRSNLPERLEILLPSPLTGGYIWHGYRRRSRSRLRQLTIWPTIPKNAPLYEHHTRFINESGIECYAKDLFIIGNESLYPLMWPSAPPYVQIRQSLIDILVDTMMNMLVFVPYRQNLQSFWQVRWQYQQRQLWFGASERAVKELAAIREGPRTTPSGRRNPLLHWVTEHLRRISDGETEHFIPISEHLRGTELFTIDDYSAEIINPAKAK